MEKKQNAASMKILNTVGGSIASSRAQWLQLKGLLMMRAPGILNALTTLADMEKRQNAASMKIPTRMASGLNVLSPALGTVLPVI